MCKYRLVELYVNFQYFILSPPPICVIVEFPAPITVVVKHSHSPRVGAQTVDWYHFITTVFGQEPAVKSMSEQHTVQYIAVVLGPLSSLFVHVINFLLFIFHC